jgi:hypothetical protein
MSSITDFISASVAEKPQKAYDAFAAALEPKINAALSAKYDEVTSSVFNQGQYIDTEETNDE